jgi:hypothetical protein
MSQRIPHIKRALMSTLNTMKHAKGTDAEIVTHKAILMMRRALRMELTGENSDLELCSAISYLQSASIALGFSPFVVSQ